MLDKFKNRFQAGKNVQDSAVIYGSTDIGLVRGHNEDSYIVLQGESKLGNVDSVMVVADGMGGHAAGEVASSITVSEIKAQFDSGKHSDLDTQEFMRFLERTFETANIKVIEAGQDNDKRGMGTTCTLVVFRGGKLHYAHVGDSRAYLVRKGRIKQITTDHSWVQESVDAGILTVEEARTHSNRNVITRAIGLDSKVKVDLGIHELKNGDLIVLCSDGLNSMISDTEIQRMTDSCLDVELCPALVNAAKNAGGDDNITVITARVSRPRVQSDGSSGLSDRDTIDVESPPSIIAKLRGLIRNDSRRDRSTLDYEVVSNPGFMRSWVFNC